MLQSNKNKRASDSVKRSVNTCNLLLFGLLES